MASTIFADVHACMKNKDTEFINGLYKRLEIEERALIVRRSKLEKYIDILQDLVSQEPKKLTQLVHETALSQSELKKHLNFLVQQNLIKRQNLGNGKIFYAITERGLRVLRVVVPIVEEAHKIQASQLSTTV